MGRLNLNFTKYIGDTFYFYFTVEDEVSVSGFQAIWIAAATPTSDPVIVKTTADDITMFDDKVIVAVKRTDTSAFLAGEFYHEITLFDTDDEGGVLGVGYFDLKKPLTDV